MLREDKHFLKKKERYCSWLMSSTVSVPSLTYSITIFQNTLLTLHVYNRFFYFYNHVYNFYLFSLHFISTDCTFCTCFPSIIFYYFFLICSMYVRTCADNINRSKSISHKFVRGGFTTPRLSGSNHGKKGSAKNLSSSNHSARVPPNNVKRSASANAEASSHRARKASFRGGLGGHEIHPDPLNTVVTDTKSHQNDIDSSLQAHGHVDHSVLNVSVSAADSKIERVSITSISANLLAEIISTVTFAQEPLEHKGDDGGGDAMMRSESRGGGS